MSVPYTFASATGSIPLAELDANFATPITLGSTPMILGGTYTTISGMTLSSPTLNSPTINSPTFSSLALGTPTSGNLSGCSGYNPTQLGSGLVPTANLATGTASNATYLRGDQTWGSPPAPSSLNTGNYTILQVGGKLYFQYNGTNIASLDNSGNFIALAVKAGATP